MKTLAFSLAVTLLVVGRCQGGAIPEQFGGETPGGGSQGSGTGGAQSGMGQEPPGPCGREAVQVPTLTCATCPSPLTCGTDGTSCCLGFSALSGQCDKGKAVPMMPGSDCSDPSKCDGTCGTPFQISTITVPICCLETSVPPRLGEDGICPSMSHADTTLNCDNSRCQSCAEKVEESVTKHICCVEGEYHCDYETSCETKDQCTTVESRMKGGDCYQPYGKQTKHCCLLALTSAQPPDMPQCEDVDQFLGAVILKPDCSTIFQELLNVQNEDAYCSQLLRGIECFSRESFPNDGLQSNICLNKLKQLVTSDLKNILEKVKAIVELMTSQPVDMSRIESYDPRNCPAIGDGSTIDMGKYTCTVDYNRDGQVDMTFHAGESYPDGEACNYCTCSGENMAACTEMACLPSQGDQKLQCKVHQPKILRPTNESDGDSRPMGSGGAGGSTSSNAGDQGGLTEQETYVDSGTWHPAGDGCNHCYCYDGRYKCTKRNCSPRPKPAMRCPAVPITSDTECLTTMQCDANKPCDKGYHCCKTACGGGTECKPDLGVCEDVNSMIQFSTLKRAEECGQYFVTVATVQQSSEDFCTSFFDGIKCLAEKLAGDTTEVRERERIMSDCERRMMAHLMQNGAEALRKIMDHIREGGTGVQQVDHNPAQCEVVRRHIAEKAMTDADESDGEARPSQPEFIGKAAEKCADVTAVFEAIRECMPNFNQGQNQGQGQSQGQGQGQNQGQNQGQGQNSGRPQDQGQGQGPPQGQQSQGQGQSQGNTQLKSQCEGLKGLFRCVVVKLGGQDDEDECLGAVKELLERHRDNMANLPIQKCHDMDHVCGEGKMPHPVKHCGEGDKEGCPGGFECRKDFCCPKEREGMCPEMKGPPNCANQECEVDDDCDGDDEKCCGYGKICGNKICVSITSTNKSKCHQEFDKAVEKLGQLGVCGGDGKTLIEVPICLGENYGPVQGDFRRNQLHCSKEDGTKVKGAEFQGVKNCVKENEGKCPALPTVCSGIDVSTLQGSCRNDADCPTKGQKCCPSQVDGACFKVCQAPRAVSENDVTPIQACPNNEERSCCPVTFNVGKRCPAHPGAIPRINPCGGCKTEWFNKDGNKVDCLENLSKCRREQAIAMEKNMRMRPEAEQLALFIKDLRQYHRAPEKEEKDEYDDVAREIEELETDDEDYGNWTEDEQKRYMGWISERICQLMNKQMICQNGGSCALQMENRRPHQLCSCPAGFGGLFCEKASKPEPCKTVNCVDNPCNTARCPKHPGATCHANYCGGCNAQFLLNAGTANEKDVTFDCSDCRVNKMLSDETIAALKGYGPKAMMMHKLLTLMPPKHHAIPMWECDDSVNQTGKFKPIQNMLMIPVVGEGTRFQVCVNPETGMRVNNTPIVYEQTEQPMNCDLRLDIDPALRHPQSWLKKYAECTGTISECQYFFNIDTEKVEQGSAGWGFNTINEAYDKSRPMTKEDLCPPVPANTAGLCAEMCGESCPAGQKCCSNGCGHVCKPIVNKAPLPCQDLQCNYTIEYCDVTINPDTGDHVGTCKQFQSHCLLPMDPGYGKAKIGAYFFDSAKRMCHRFTYHGMGGNKNRFSSLHQCQTECAMRYYTYSEPVCPHPKLLAPKGMVSVDMCDDDSMCEHDGMKGVCCSDGKHRVCTMPVKNCQGHRCSFYGECDANGMCYCPKCDASAGTQKVCGSDMVTYDNECKLRMAACTGKKKIYKKSDGACPANPTTPMGEECAATWPCTKEYRPLCALHKYANGSIATKSFSNPCEFAKFKKCNNEDLEVLYMGHCMERPCGANSNCKLYHTECVNGQCGCKTDCSQAEYHPVCGHPHDLPDQAKVFGSLCEMQRYGCENDKIYVVSHTPGACSKVEKTEEELYECPKFDSETMMEMPGMDAMNCDVKDNNFCARGRERCCQFGQGTHCIPKEKLVKKRFEPSGMPQILSSVSFQMKNCLAARCKEEGDYCKGDTICSENFVCGHKTCAPPIVKPTSSAVCPANHYMIPKMLCNGMDPDNSGCPLEAQCTAVTRGHTTLHVCCAPTNAKSSYTKEVIFKAKLIHHLTHMGIKCENNGVLDPNLEESQVCDCAGTGFTGAFCTDASGTTNTKCTRQKALMAKLAMKMRDLITMVTEKGDDDDSKEKDSDSDREGMGPGTGDGGSMGNADDREDGERAGMQSMGKFMDDMHEYIEKMLLEEKPGVEFVKLLAMEKGLKYLLLDVECDAQGNFKDAQCGITLEKPHHHGCFCIDRTKWWSHLPGPMADERTKIDCNMIKSDTGIPQFCFKRPMMGGKNSMAGRYYFNPDTADCHMFKEGQWSSPNGNNFPTYETCRSTCSSTSWRASPCQTARCAAGTACRGMMGKTVDCKNVTKPNEIPNHFEPKCSKEGKFNPKQCTCTMCFCVNPETGEPIPGAIGAGEELGCQLDPTSPNGVKVTLPQTTQRFACDPQDGVAVEPKVCKAPGHPCHNCMRTVAEMDQGQGGQGQMGQGGQGQMGQGGQGQMGQGGQGQGGQGQMGQGQGGQGQDQDRTGNMYGGLKVQQTNENGVCRNCGSCPSGQGNKRCPTKCPEDIECANFPEAQCFVDRCTCAYEWKSADGLKVKCDEPHPHCLKTKDNIIKKGIYKQLEKAQKQAEGETVEEVVTEVELHCTPGGSFESNCTVKGNGKKSCFCLNPNNGKPEHATPIELSENEEKPNCAEAQKKKIVKKKFKLKIAEGRLSDWSEAKKEKVKREQCKKVEEVGKMKCENPQLIEGSIIFVFDGSALTKINNETGVVESAGVDDLDTLSAAFLQAVANGEVAIQVDGQTFVASDGAVTGQLTAEDLAAITTTAKKLEPEDDNKKTVIIVVVVVVVVVLLIIAAAGVYVQQGELVIVVDGVTYTASEGIVTAALTAEEITTPGPQPTTKKVEKEDGINEKASIIIVCVIVGLIVIFFVVVAAVFCYKKSKSKKGKDYQFDDIAGKSNPAYEKTAY